MNFITATVELKSHSSDTITFAGIDYCVANAVVPSANSNGEVKLRLLCYNNEGPKLKAFKGWQPNSRVLVSGQVSFSDDPKEPLDLIIKTLEPNIPQNMYINQIVLGNAFFGDDQIKERKNNQVAVKIGTTLDDSEITTWLYMETHEQRKKKISARIRKGRPICVQGYLREYRKDDSDSAYRAIVADDFTTRKERAPAKRGAPSDSSSVGYSEIDPTPDY
mgnify:FL=1|tara:strand:- start:2789 stop:3448 length:660 start_codon:yes stop_codon:yes gene_type:complete